MCKVMEDLRNESYAEGREEGREEQAKITAFRMGKKGRSPEEIAELIDFDVETVKKMAANYRRVKDQKGCCADACWHPFLHERKGFIYLCIVFFMSLGCDKNLVDSEEMLGALVSRGFEVTDDESQAENDMPAYKGYFDYSGIDFSKLNLISETTAVEQKNMKAMRCCSFYRKMNIYMRFMRSDIDPVCISMCRPGFFIIKMQCMIQKVYN